METHTKRYLFDLEERERVNGWNADERERERELSVNGMRMREGEKEKERGGSGEIDRFRECLIGWCQAEFR